MDKAIRVGLIYGSTREGRFCDKVAAWAADQIASSGKFAIDIVDPLATALGAAKPNQEHPASLRHLVDRAEAFVVVTPEYNHGYPAPLKALIDSVGAEWQAKPVAFVSNGGVSGGLRAVEQLRQVFAELHAVTMRDAVSFAGAWEQFDQSGKLREPERANKSMATMLARLHWWAVALRSARSEAPYSTAA